MRWTDLDRLLSTRVAGSDGAADVLAVIGTLGSAGLIALLVSERHDFRAGTILGKLTASTAFLAFALAIGALATPVGRLVFAGMLFCWIGDALLLSRGTSISFGLGIGAFLLGHLAYAVAFQVWGIDWMVFGIACLCVGWLGWCVLRWLTPHVPSTFRLAIRCYVIVIGTMVACAIGASAGGANAFAAIGAIAFATSDLSVARERFVAPSFVNSLWGLPLYYAAQIALAIALVEPAASWD